MFPRLYDDPRRVLGQDELWAAKSGVVRRLEDMTPGHRIGVLALIDAEKTPYQVLNSMDTRGDRITRSALRDPHAWVRESPLAKRLRELVDRDQRTPLGGINLEYMDGRHDFLSGAQQLPVEFPPLVSCTLTGRIPGLQALTIDGLIRGLHLGLSSRYGSWIRLTVPGKIYGGPGGNKRTEVFNWLSRLRNDAVQVTLDFENESNVPVFSSSGGSAAADNVNHPSHYTQARVECIEIISDLQLNYNLGAAMKYLWRCTAKHQDPLEDLKKCAWYIAREIEERERA